ncbi:hypothetical protein SAMN04487959_10848 [Modicisalibacter xianhensis]|uniref:Uncharacterized protein n=2 Tax=Modicisalibacter xianhensis TaxID=442341 RepID=A0A1I3C8I8_9GAMM|nr:hypothetical protein SAMN04487959_10848 [Halomonas xianhensis]
MSAPKKMPRTPSGEALSTDLYDPRLRWSMWRARWTSTTREAFERRVIRPLEDRLFQRWLTNGFLADQVEEMGLPYRSVDDYLGESLDLRIDPRQLICSLSMKKSFPKSNQRNKAKNLFIWKGDWDLVRYDFHKGQRYTFINDIWLNRHALEQSQAYRELVSLIEKGKPFTSHQKGLLLNTPDKVLAYLETYVGYMNEMARTGFDNSLGKDRLGVAIDRHGGIVKINRGLHRLAMAQVLGLEEIVVRVRAVHADWWRDVMQGETGEKALQNMAEALRESKPAGLEPGKTADRA